MGFDGRLSIKERIIKRRKQRRKRAFIILFFIMMCIMAYTAINNGLNHKDREQVFLDKSPVQSDSQIIDTIEHTPLTIPGSIGEASSVFITAEPTYENNIKSVTKEYIDESVSENVEGIIEQENFNLEELREELKEYVSDYTGQYGIYFIDLVDGYEFGIDDTDEYIAASTVKVPLNYYVFKMIEEGEVNPEKQIAYVEADFEGGSGILQRKRLEGKAFTIRYLLELSIKYSDNIATNMLLRYFGRNNLKSYMRSLGGTVVDDNKNVSCPKDMAIYLKKVYEFCNENNELGEEFKQNLCNTVYNNRLPRLLPKEVEVAHKIGDQIQAVHDVGIIYSDKPYVLAVMSKGVISDQEAHNVIAQISKKVYDYVKNR